MKTRQLFIFSSVLVFFLFYGPTGSAELSEPGKWRLVEEIVLLNNPTPDDLVTHLKSEFAVVRKASLFRIHESNDSSYEEVIWPLLNDETWSVRRMAAYALETCGTKKAALS